MKRLAVLPTAAGLLLVANSQTVVLSGCGDGDVGILQQAYVKASNTDRSDLFGESLALDGDTLAVGAAAEASGATGVGGDETDNSAERSGAVYVFQ